MRVKVSSKFENSAHSRFALAHTLSHLKVGHLALRTIFFNWSATVRGQIKVHNLLHTTVQLKLNTAEFHVSDSEDSSSSLNLMCSHSLFFLISGLIHFACLCQTALLLQESILHNRIAEFKMAHHFQF